jgi:hypothetical protein
MRRPTAAAFAAAAIVVIGSTPSAQSRPAAGLRPGHLLLGLGGAWVGAEALGSVRAETRASALGTTSPPPFTLFDTNSRLDGGAAAEATVTMAVTPGWAVEVRGSVRQPTLTTTITSDAEAAGTFTASEDIAEYVVDASVLYHPSWAELGSRARAYLLAGGGYLRQLHDDNALVATGSTVHVGAGTRLWLAGGHGRGVEAGLTGDVRWVVRRDGITFDEGRRSLPALSVRAFVGF